MNRRSIGAALLVVALAALVVALVSSGGGGEGAEAMKGRPFTGNHGVTRSVASIKALQRYRDRHPEIERRRTAVLAAGEAAREEAARESGQEAREEQGAPGEEEGAAEEPAVAGAEEDTNIREKPEPGGEGEGLPPKQAGPSTRQQRVGSAAITPRQAVTPSPSDNFLGANSNESGFVPPDSMGSVGPTQILVAVNGRIKAFDKDDQQVSLNVSDVAFWAPVRNGSEPTDPGVEYDRLSQRWIVSAINTEDSNNRIMLAVSEGPTITSTSDFTYFFFNQAAPPPSASPRFADYPQLGVDANAIYIGVNEFAAPPTTGFLGTTVYVIRKSSVLGVGPIVVTAFRNLTAGGHGPVSPQPATDMVPSVGLGYVVGPDFTDFSRLDIRRISNPGGTPSISGNLVVPVPPTFVPTATPFAVPAQGTPPVVGLDALDDRLFEAMIGRDPTGAATLWTAHNLLVNSSGVSSSSGNRAGARWYQLGNLDATPSLVQSGTLFDDQTVPDPRWFWMPSIAMSGQGHASLNASTAGTGRFAQIALSGRLFGPPLSTTDDPVITNLTPTGGYNLGSATPRRWGDYSQTVVDPTDNMSFWTFQEYASNQDQWGVRVVKLEPPPPATPSTSNPSTIPQGQCALAVDVVGTTTSGSGFFDPGSDSGGPGYDSHITASATGGVAVNDVIYTDPTHVTLDLDTTQAGAGSVDVTIINPDGQEVTANGLLTVGAPATGPTTPCLDGTSPPSPRNDNNPKVFGRADAGSTVTLYSDDTCTGTEVGSGNASDFNDDDVGIPVDPPVDDNSETTYYATVTDGMTTSACSSTLQTSSSQQMAEASETYVEDSIAPNVGISAGPGLTNDRTPSFTFSGSDQTTPIPPSLPLNFECSIDQGMPDFGPCDGPGTTHTSPSALADGFYTFRVRATDAAGNLSTTDATRSFQVDATPPTVSVNSGPTGTTADQSPTFTFSGSDTAGPVSFLCSIDAGSAAFRACSGPGNSDTPTSPLGDGSYNFRARASDQAGNSSVATRSFSVQTPKPPQPPETTINKGPKKTRKARPKFRFSSTDPNATFQCKLDKRKFVACASQFTTPKLRPGKHKLQVRAVGAGGVDQSPAVRKFRILPPK
ncbi:MAG TPA: Ig-like domain-containing protein [Solirubrobacterales bacterium]